MFILQCPMTTPQREGSLKGLKVGPVGGLCTETQYKHNLTFNDDTIQRQGAGRF